MRYYSEETVKKIMQEVEVKETQCNVYDNLYSVQRIYPNLDNFESIELVEPHGRLIDADVMLKATRFWSLGRSDDYFDLKIKNTIIKAFLDTAPTVLEASKEESK